VVAAIAKAAKTGTSFGAPCELEVRLAEEVVKAVPSIQKVRFVSSGTEAVMGAIRAARGFTGRKKIIKFDGCYHGHADYLLVKAGSGAQTLGQPDSAGVPQEFTNETLVARFNDATSVEAICKAYPSEIAAVIVEPVVGNMGVIPPRDGFLKRLREICDREEIVLIFDEVMTGFRLAYGGAQEVYGVKPDLTTLGKIIGGGMPVGAYGGRTEIMDMVAPVGPVYQAGTLSGNPVAMTAGLETLKILKATKPYKKLEKVTKELCDGFREAAKKTGVPVTVSQAGSMFTVFFAEGEIKNADDARRCDTGSFAAFFRSMLEMGISLSPSQFEACFVSAMHTPGDLSKTIKAASRALTQVGHI
jgi:glutamate-1-semialdehyde 2,1-aminomutase